MYENTASALGLDRVAWDSDRVGRTHLALTDSAQTICRTKVPRGEVRRPLRDPDVAPTCSECWAAVRGIRSPEGEVQLSWT